MGRPLPGVAPAQHGAGHLYPLRGNTQRAGEIQHPLVLFQQEVQHENRKFRLRRHGPQSGHVATRLRKQRAHQLWICGDMGKARIRYVACFVLCHSMLAFRKTGTRFVRSGKVLLTILAQDAALGLGCKASVTMAGRILVVDGLPTNRITMKVRLASACYEVATATSGAEALHMARLIQPQIVLIGASLPDMDGPALCTALRALPCATDVPVLVQASGSNRIAALRAGATALIDTASDELTLLARIRGLMRHEIGVPDHPALGMAEAAAGFVPDSRSRVVFVADQPATALGWRHALRGRVDFTMLVREPEQALVEAASNRVADLYLIAADIQQRGDGLRLLSELRARPHSREAAIVIALRPERLDMMPVALDLGAGDVLPWDLAGPEAATEAAMRLQAQLLRKQEADRLRHETQRNMRWAMIDPLTGLHNRRFALPRLAGLAANAQEYPSDLAVMLLDLDRFKLVNDLHGHPAGDAVLTEIAARLAATLPEDALLARIGGEEFLAVLPDCPATTARRVAEDLRRAVMSEPIPLPQGCRAAELDVTISVGIAMGHGGPQLSPLDPKALLASADRALLWAKSSGRNRIVMAPQEIAA